MTLVVLLIFGAFAVDLGQLYAERRVDQNAADAAATSGAVVLLSNQSLQGSVDEILAKVTADVGRTVAAAQWTACTDPGQLTLTASELNLTPKTPCISFSQTFTRLRVRLPEQTLSTFFGGVVGVDSVTSSAFTEVEIIPRGGGALPFVVLAVNGPGDQICLRTNDTAREPPDHPAIPPYQTARELDPCHEDRFDTAEGGRGTLLPWQYTDCSSVGNATIVSAIMRGTDHLLGVFPDPGVTLTPGDDADLLDSHASARIDGGPSGDCLNALPNTIDVDSGLTAGLLRCALLQSPCDDGTDLTDGTAGRLSDSGSSSTFTGLDINDTPLWDYLISSPPSGSCADAANSGLEFNLRRAAMVDCLQTWTSGVIFTEDIGSDPRFGYVPRIAELGMCRIQPPEDTACSGTLPDHVHINNFSPVYVDGVYQYNADACDATNPAFIPPPTGNDRWAIHYPGAGFDCGDTSGGVDRISGIVLPCGALPPSVCEPSNNPPYPDPAGIYQIRIAR